MNLATRLAAMVFMVLLFAFPLAARSASAANTLDENGAVHRLEHVLKRDGIYKHRISLSCVGYVTEESTEDYFEFALREHHTNACGGDPQTQPVVDRYRVYRQTGKLEWLEITSGEWRRYDPAAIPRGTTRGATWAHALQ
ncbi:MAG: hypothetical protein ABI411_04630 [Tahibacter sp.]